MPGNEIEIAKFLITRKGAMSLPKLGLLRSIGAPAPGEGYIEIESAQDVDRLLRSDASAKKADIYINGKGVSLKQTGPSFLFNRAQRKNLEDTLRHIHLGSLQETLSRIDNEVQKFHKGQLEGRNRDWRDFFHENDFRELCRFLMMLGSPNLGMSLHPADFILEAPSMGMSSTNMNVFNFEEYFEAYKNDIKISIRRQWVGQRSNSEHARAVGIAADPGNVPWVFDDVAGAPRTGWRSDVPANERKTVYILMIEKT